MVQKNTEADSNRSEDRQADAALADLRDRDARGELDDEEFETRVERLLETESIADAESFVKRHGRADRENKSNESEREPRKEQR